MENTANPTREEIMSLLKKSNGMTVEQMSEALGISAMGVRQHLAILEKKGHIDASKKRGGMGRPAYVYALTDEGDETFPRQYDQLAITLIESLYGLEGGQAVEAVFQKRTEMLNNLLRTHVTGESLGERVEGFVRIQDQLGYMAEVEESPEGYTITQYNCTISHVAKRFPIACRLEHELFQRLLSAPVERRRCIGSGDHACVYFTKKREAEAGREQEAATHIS